MRLIPVLATAIALLTIYFLASTRAPSTPEERDTGGGEKEAGEEGCGVGSDEGGDEASNTERQELEARQPALVSNFIPALPYSLATPRGRGQERMRGRSM